MKDVNNKKLQQLGMPHGTASNRLVKDILFSFITKAEYKCFHCNGDLSREDFTIEHKVPWLDSSDPLKTFFDLDNISFSHYSCNARAARKPTRLSAQGRVISDEIQRERSRERKHRNYTTENRRATYLRTGK